MNKYEELRKLIYDKKYPNGIPLEQGSQFIIPNKGFATPWTYYATVSDTYNFVIQNYEGTGFCHLEKWQFDKLENIGKPLTLRDVLWAMPYDCKAIKNATSKGERYMNIYSRFEEGGQLVVSLGLTLPPSQWSEEVLSKLIELIK